MEEHIYGSSSVPLERKSLLQAGCEDLMRLPSSRHPACTLLDDCSTSYLSQEHEGWIPLSCQIVLTRTAFLQMNHVTITY